MRQEDIWDADTAQRYDTRGSGMFAPEVLEPTVDHLAELAGNGRALEFAIGTGRVAVPLAIGTPGARLGRKREAQVCGSYVLAQRGVRDDVLDCAARIDNCLG
jgi:hypothetical protein